MRLEKTSGEISQSYGKNVYKMEKNGVSFTVVTGNSKNNQERVITFYSNRGLREDAHSLGAITSTSPSDKTIPQNTLKSHHGVGGSLVGGSAGFEIDDQGNLNYNTEKGALGAVAGYAVASRFGKRNMQGQFEKIARTKEAFDDITGTKGTLRRLFTNTLNDGYMVQREARQQAINVEATKIERLHKALLDFNEADRKALHEYLQGDRHDLPAPMQELGKNIRHTIDNLSRKLLDDGILSKEAYEEWVGKYIHRSYEKHLGLGGVIEGAKNIGKMFVGRSARVDQSTIPEIHRRGKLWVGGAKELQELQSSGMLGRVADGKIAVREVSPNKYEFRRDWTKQEREAMKEITDSAYTIPETLMRLQIMHKNGQFLKSLEGVDGVVLPASQASKFPDLKGTGYAKVPDSSKYGVLAGKTVRQDVLDDIQAFNDSVNKTLFGSDNPLARAWLSYQSAWKKSKTVWNAPTHLSNFNSNFFLMHLAGMRTNEIGSSFMKSAKLIYMGKDYEELAIKKELGRLTADESKKLDQMGDKLKYYLEAKELGIFGRSQLNDILRGHLMGNRPLGKLGKLDKFAQDMYQGEDNINRMAMYSFLREKHNMKPSEAKEFVNSIMPDYTKPMPAGFRFLRDSGVAPFISWSYYTVPTILRLMKTKQGASQMVKVLGALAGLEAMVGINPMSNLPFVDGDKPSDFKMRRFGVANDRGNIDTIKVDRWIPYVEMFHPANFVLSMGSGTTTQAIVNLGTAGSRQGSISAYSGRPVSPAYRNAGETAYDWTKYGAGTYAPLPPQLMGLWQMAENKVLDKKFRQKSKDVVPRTDTQELLKFLGLNTMTYDPREVQRANARAREK